jgi:hypothetical protein
MGLSVCVLGIVMVGIDIAAGMPFWWTVSEGPTAVAAGLLLAYLSRKDHPSPADHS